MAVDIMMHVANIEHYGELQKAAGSHSSKNKPDHISASFWKLVGAIEATGDMVEVKAIYFLGFQILF